MDYVKYKGKRVSLRLEDEDLARNFEIMCFFLEKSAQEVLEDCVRVGFQEMIRKDPAMVKRIKDFSKSLD